MKTRTITMLLALALAAHVHGATKQETIRELAIETRQPVSVVRNLLRSFPATSGISAAQAKQAHRTILQSYTVDALPVAQAMRCNGYLAQVRAGRGHQSVQDLMARECPSLWRWIGH